MVQPVRYEARGDIAIITLDRPTPRNAVDAAGARIAATEDAREGPQAFAETRPVLWMAR